MQLDKISTVTDDCSGRSVEKPSSRGWVFAYLTALHGARVLRRHVQSAGDVRPATLFHLIVRR
nr:MAG TPA: hypothetical protein [Caudoviricetes sp.]